MAHLALAPLGAQRMSDVGIGRMLQQDETTTALQPLDLSFYHRTDTLLGRLAQMAQPNQCGRRMTMENLHDEQDPSFQLPVVTFGDSATLTAQSPQRRAKVLLNALLPRGRDPKSAASVRYESLMSQVRRVNERPCPPSAAL